MMLSLHSSAFPRSICNSQPPCVTEEDTKARNREATRLEVQHRTPEPKLQPRSSCPPATWRSAGWLQAQPSGPGEECPPAEQARKSSQRGLLPLLQEPASRPKPPAQAGLVPLPALLSPLPTARDMHSKAATFSKRRIFVGPGLALGPHISLLLEDPHYLPCPGDASCSPDPFLMGGSSW